MSHAEIARKKGLGQSWNSCHQGHLILVAEGLQCVNCLAVTSDHGRTWKTPEEISRKAGAK